MRIKTSNLEDILKKVSEKELSDLVETVQTREFCSELELLLNDKNITKSDIIKNTLLDRNYAYQIFQGTKIGSKDKVVQICLALKCTLNEANRLLTLSNNATLYAKVKRDMYLIYALEHTLSVMETTDLLLKNNCEILS